MAEYGQDKIDEVIDFIPNPFYISSEISEKIT